MKILLVEDNIPFAEDLVDLLQRRFGDVLWLQSESDFRLSFERISQAPPAVAVIDVMLKWDVPRREGIRPKPDDVTDMYRAGIRCSLLLASNARTSAIPIILYTSVDRSDMESELADLPPNVRWLEKTSDPIELIDAIREVHG